MREIKFRAWDAAAKQMLHMPMIGTFGLHRFFGFIPDDAPIMQFTGLFDKNGQEIYEGDIIDHNNRNFEIMFSIKNGWIAKEIGRPENFRKGDWIENVKKYITIIGNIHTQKP